MEFLSHNYVDTLLWLALSTDLNIIENMREYWFGMYTKIVGNWKQRRTKEGN